MILIPVWTFFLLGAHHGARAAAAGRSTRPRSLAGLLSFTALLGAIYIMNQIADRAADLEGEQALSHRHGESSRCARPGSRRPRSSPSPSPWRSRSCRRSSARSSPRASPSARPTRSSPCGSRRRPVLDVLANAAGNGVLNTLAGWIAVGAPLAGWRSLAPLPVRRRVGPSRDDARRPRGRFEDGIQDERRGARRSRAGSSSRRRSWGELSRRPISRATTRRSSLRFSRFPSF